MENTQETAPESADEPAPPNVVRLAEFRKRRQRLRQAATQECGPQYYCLRCDGDEFKLFASGMVHCAHCGSMMRNLLVSATKSEEAPQQ